MKKLRIAVQKSGRMSEQSLQLLEECGISFANGDRNYLAVSKTFPIEIIYLRDDDIPDYVNDGVTDAGIVGENVRCEKCEQLPVEESLGFAKCRLALAVPKAIDFPGLEWFQRKKIATSYPVILQEFLHTNRIEAEIHEIKGSVEVAPSLGLSDAIFDIVGTGSTLISNGLKEVETVLRSEAVLISCPNLAPDARNLLEQLRFRIKSVLRARSHKYLLLNAPNEKLAEIIRLVPGASSPTIVPLAKEGWSAVHAVMNEDRFWEVIGQLKDAGAEGILVVPIEKMVM